MVFHTEKGMVQAMVNERAAFKKHKPPSRIKYDENNPPVTVRLTKELREIIDLIKGDQSYADVIKYVLTHSAEDLYEIYIDDKTNNAFKQGYNKARATFEIKYPCAKCGKPTTLFPYGEIYKDVLEFLKQKPRGHSKCP